VSDGEVFPRVFQNRFLLCACTATAQLRKGRGRKTRQASNATMLIDPPQISATTSRILMWSVRSFNPRPTLVSNPKRGLDARGRAPSNWANVYNLDTFPREVNLYYDGKSLFCIISGQGRRSTHPASGSLQLCHLARSSIHQIGESITSRPKPWLLSQLETRLEYHLH
jgi:hypothetical protein